MTLGKTVGLGKVSGPGRLPAAFVVVHLGKAETQTCATRWTGTEWWPRSCLSPRETPDCAHLDAVSAAVPEGPDVQAGRSTLIRVPRWPRRSTRRGVGPRRGDAHAGRLCSSSSLLAESALHARTACTRQAASSRAPVAPQLDVGRSAPCRPFCARCLHEGGQSATTTRTPRPPGATAAGRHLLT